MRVMTYNIWNYSRPWKERREQIAALISRHRPDAVALQETRHDFRFERGEGQGNQIARLTGYHPTFAVGQVYFPVLRVDEGLTVLTMQEPRHVQVRRLTQLHGERGDENQRICLQVTIDAGGAPFHVFDTHFSLSETARISNAREVSDLVAQQAGDEAAVVMGDLNAEPDTPPIRFLTAKLEVDGERGDFVDCWLAANPEAQGYTYASWGGIRRIDYILARNIRSVRSAEIVGGAATGGVYPSDHMGIVADLEV